MADNVTLDAMSGGSVIATDDIGAGVQAQLVKVLLGADGANDGPVETDNPLPVRPYRANQPGDSSFTRPANTTAYSIGDLIANNTTAGSVTPLSFTGATLTGSGGAGRISLLIASKSNSAAARIRYHFLKTSHAVTNGDNGALVFTSLDLDNYIGFMDVAFTGTDDAIGSSGALVEKSYDAPLTYNLASGDTIYVFLEALTAFTPGNAEVFAVKPTFEATE